MPYRIDWEPRGVYKKYTGRVTGQEFIQAVQAVNASPDFQNYHYVINDFSDCIEFDLSAGQFDDALAAAIGAHAINPKFVAAFVAPGAAHLDTLETLSAKANAHLRTAVFSNLKDARRWVDQRRAI